VTARALFRLCAVLCLAAWLLPACAAPSAARKREAEARMRMGINYLDQHNLPMAMTELSRASKLDPDNAEIDMVTGLAYRARGDRDRAEEYLRSAIDKKPDYAEAHNNLGIVLADRKAWDEAIREFEKAAANVQYATPEWAIYNAAESYRAKGDPAKAEEAYRRVIRANDRYAPAYVGLGEVLVSEGRWEEAAAVLRQCVGRAPDYADGWMALGRVAARLQRKPEAVKAFQTVLSVSKDPALRKQAATYLGFLESGKR
jgi:type IV pilus biogenesis/stability protein PilW